MRYRANFCNNVEFIGLIQYATRILDYIFKSVSELSMTKGVFIIYVGGGGHKVLPPLGLGRGGGCHKSITILARAEIARCNRHILHIDI